MLAFGDDNWTTVFELSHRKKNTERPENKLKREGPEKKLQWERPKKNHSEKDRSIKTPYKSDDLFDIPIYHVLKCDLRCSQANIVELNNTHIFSWLVRLLINVVFFSRASSSFYSRLQSSDI